MGRDLAPATGLGAAGTATIYSDPVSITLSVTV